MSNEKWVPVENPDMLKRKPPEWAEKYGIRLVEDSPNELWSEYEWSYYFQDLGYFPGKNPDFDKIAEMEMRAQELRRDLFLGADIGEREVLKEKYIETAWVRARLRLI